MSCRVWSKFQATRSDGSFLKLRIQDIPENRHDDAVELIIKYFVIEEALNKAAGVPRNPKAIAECRDTFKKSMKNPASHTIICCEDKDEEGEVGQIVGVSVMSIVVAGSKPPETIKVETEEVQKLKNMLKAISDMYDPIKELKITRYFGDKGLVVQPAFRKLGIASEFIKTRCLACVEHNVPATIVVATSIATEKAAVKANWVTISEINLDNFGRQLGVTFEKTGYIMKVMIWKTSEQRDHDNVL